jgi:cytochrome c-type biogenesis protein CcmH
LCALGAIAVEVREFRDPAEEARYHALLAELRCLVCQNQSLADSNAALAGDLRQEVYELIRQGKGEEEAVAFLVARYGDFVRYRPPVQFNTWVLWAGPATLAVLALFAAAQVIRRLRPPLEVPPLTPEEEARLAAFALRAGAASGGASGAESGPHESGP